MLKIKGYDLQSFIVGTKHARAFSVNDKKGIITDFILGECGAKDSPLPKDYFDVVNLGNGIQLQNAEALHTYTVNLDKVVISERTKGQGEDIGDVEGIYGKARYLMPGTLSFIEHPKAIFLGTVYQFVESNTSIRERFSHPVASKMTNSLLKMDLNDNEYPAEINTHIVFRKKTPRGFMLKGTDDYFNVILNIGDSEINELWPDTESKKIDVKSEKTRIGTISIDIQIVFDPRRKLTEKVFDAYWSESNRILGRTGTILEGLGFEIA